MRRTLQIVLAGALVLGTSITPMAGAKNTTLRNKYASTVVSHPCVDQSQTTDPDNPQLAGTIAYTGPVKLWPPNHKYAPASVTAADEDGADNVALTTEATHDQYDGDTGTEENGSGNTADDITPAAQTTVNGTGSATQNFQIRSERSGRFKEGRTYTITYEAVFGDSDGDNSSEDATTCTGSFQIVVPHDMRPSNR